MWTTCSRCRSNALHKNAFSEKKNVLNKTQFLILFVIIIEKNRLSKRKTINWNSINWIIIFILFEVQIKKLIEKKWIINRVFTHGVTYWTCGSSVFFTDTVSTLNTKINDRYYQNRSIVCNNRNWLVINWTDKCIKNNPR